MVLLVPTIGRLTKHHVPAKLNFGAQARVVVVGANQALARQEITLITPVMPILAPALPTAAGIRPDAAIVKLTAKEGVIIITPVI